MKNLDSQKLSVVIKTRSNFTLPDWHGLFTPNSKPVEFDGFGNCWEFAVIENHTDRQAAISCSASGAPPST